MAMSKKVGVLTGGGDCPGLNAVIRAVVWTARPLGWEIVGLRNGWRGLLDGTTQSLTVDDVRGILYRGGTILGSSRTNPCKDDATKQQALAQVKKLGLDAIIAIGGEDTLGAAHGVNALGVPVVGVPKTIDNDLAETDYTFGFDTAIQTATEAIDRLTTTAESHDRVVVVEVMGRHAGWIATYAGIAGGVDVILVPEEPFDIHKVVRVIQDRIAQDRHFSIIVVAEGAKFADSNDLVMVTNKRDEFGHCQLGGIGEVVAAKIRELTDIDTRVTVLGHVLRGGTPSAYDRVLGTRFGVEAVRCIAEGDVGTMVALKGEQIARVPLDKIAGRTKTVPPEFLKLANSFRF